MRRILKKKGGVGYDLAMAIVAGVENRANHACYPVEVLCLIRWSYLIVYTKGNLTLITPPNTTPAK